MYTVSISYCSNLALVLPQVKCACTLNNVTHSEDTPLWLWCRIINTSCSNVTSHNKKIIRHLRQCQSKPIRKSLGKLSKNLEQKSNSFQFYVLHRGRTQWLYKRILWHTAISGSRVLYQQLPARSSCLDGYLWLMQCFPLASSPKSTVWGYWPTTLERGTGTYGCYKWTVDGSTACLVWINPKLSAASRNILAFATTTPSKYLTFTSHKSSNISYDIFEADKIEEVIDLNDFPLDCHSLCTVRGSAIPNIKWAICLFYYQINILGRAIISPFVMKPNNYVEPLIILCRKKPKSWWMCDNSQVGSNDLRSFCVCNSLICLCSVWQCHVKDTESAFQALAWRLFSSGRPSNAGGRNCL